MQPPAGVGLDRRMRDGVCRHVPVLALRLPSSECGAAMQQLSAYVLRLPRIKAVISDPSPRASMEAPTNTKLILIQPDGGVGGVAEREEGGSGKEWVGRVVPEEVARFAERCGGEVVPWNVRVGYGELNAVEVLKILLPEGLMAPSAFEQVLWSKRTCSL